MRLVLSRSLLPPTPGCLISHNPSAPLLPHPLTGSTSIPLACRASTLMSPTFAQAQGLRQGYVFLASLSQPGQRLPVSGTLRSLDTSLRVLTNQAAYSPLPSMDLHQSESYTFARPPCPTFPAKVLSAIPLAPWKTVRQALSPRSFAPANPAAP
jgi:hypothetical protein